MLLIKRGAEALIFLKEEGGRKIIVKKRVKKGYRIEELDKMLRKERTNREVKLLREARAVGVKTPQVYEVDEDNYIIYMQYIEGKKVKDLIEEMSNEEVKKTFEKIGEYVAMLHSSNIVHADLTTSNMIMDGSDLYFIDFGLGYFSQRIEDKGVDLKLLKEAIESTHPKFLNICWESIVNGYKKIYTNADKVLKKVDEIEKRGRYTVK